MTKRIIVLVALSLTAALAKEKPKIQIQVVETQSSTREAVYDVPGTSSQSTTNCNGNATATGVGRTTTVNGNNNCTTTTAPGRPAQRNSISIPQTKVPAIMPDGRHVTLWRQRGLRKCAGLEVGKYEAELDGNSVWVSSVEFSGKTDRIKYQYIGGW